MLEGSADVTVGPRQGAEPTWLVGPLQLTRSHQRVTFLPGTLIYAANDSFHGKGDCLFRLMSTSNVTVVGYGCGGPSCGKSGWIGPAAAGAAEPITIGRAEPTKPGGMDTMTG